ncbi:MAG: TIR domain-containing protein [Phototrophicaceae bacterium]
MNNPHSRSVTIVATASLIVLIILVSLVLVLSSSFQTNATLKSTVPPPPLALTLQTTAMLLPSMTATPTASVTVRSRPTLLPTVSVISTVSSETPLSSEGDAPTETPTERSVESNFPTDPPPTGSDSGDAPTEAPTRAAFEELPTDAPDVLTPVSTPLEVAFTASSFSIISASGEEVGSGTVRAYYDESVAYGQTTRIELELAFDYLYITPTPRGLRTAVAVTPRPTSSAARPSATPRPPAVEQPDITIYQRMGATLTCAPSSFVGCDDGLDLSNGRFIGYNGMSWSWILAPRDGVEGLQALTLDLWTVDLVNGTLEQANVVWSHDFTINATVPRVPLAWLAHNWPIFAAIAGVIVVLVGGGLLAYWNLSRVRSVATAPSTSNATVTPPTRVTAFISYRRKVSWEIANFINDKLEGYGADIFLDVDDIHEGRFADIITRNIDAREYFIVLLAPGTLESEWVVKEIRYAIDNKKKIIPVLLNGFDLYGAEMPESLKDIATYNAVEISPKYLDAGIQRIAVFMGVLKA